ncbi:TolC family protein, partial [Mesorhizobium sp. GbtcB19]|uniref:TolC family protein n=1 Tax=Mesorhizobium sp. GbtcB19 TaxID=2824764 RepID=UPI001C2F230D
PQVPSSLTNPNGSSTSANIGATLTIPICSGGRTEALVRQDKESLSEARIQDDVSRAQVRQAVVSARTQYVAALVSVDAN